MKEILDFLRDLEKNNNREWFNSHKEQYQSVLKNGMHSAKALLLKSDVLTKTLLR
jgi:conserved hypothetical protein (DUF2461)